MRRALAIAGLLFCIGGIVGLIYNFKGFPSGSAGWIQGNITFGTFVAVGLAVLTCLTIASYAED